MATDHARQTDRSLVVHSYWPYAVLLGGLVGAIRPALAMVGDIGPTVGVLTTLPELQLWWVLHIGYSAVFATGYGLIVYHRRLRRFSESVPAGAVLGLGYGVALWLGNIVVGWNVVLAPHLLSSSEPIDPLAVGPIADHLVYGIALGVAYAVVVPRLDAYRR